MKTSLIYLLLLAAVACAAPRAGEMPGEKRVGMAEKMWEKMAEEKREEVVNAAAEAKSDVENESRSDGCNGRCISYDGERAGCFVETCDYEYDEMFEPYNNDCFCCFLDDGSTSCP